MPAEEYEYNDDIYYDETHDEMSRASRESQRNNTFGKVQRRYKKKNKIVIGTDEYGNDECIFASRGQGNYICSATSGYQTLYKVGSPNENLFFSVIDSSRLFDRRSGEYAKEPCTFYFDSPEQFERVMGKYLAGGSVSQKSKEEWHKKYLIAKNRIVNNTR